MNSCSPQMTHGNGVILFCDMGDTSDIRYRRGQWNTVGWWEIVCTDRTEWTRRGWQAPFCG